MSACVLCVRVCAHPGCTVLLRAVGMISSFKETGAVNTG